MPPAAGFLFAEKLLLLARDATLIEAVASVVDAQSLIVVGDESELAAHLLSDDPGVVFIDAAMADARPGTTAALARRLHEQLPDVVLVVAGDNTAQSELAALVGEGTIYRFVHKPVSAQRVKLFVDAAWRKRNGTSGASGLYPALSMPPAAPVFAARRPPWPAILVAVAVGGAALAGLLLRAHPPQGAVAPEAAPSTGTREAPAPVSPAPAADATTAAAALAASRADLDRLATAAEQALLAGNLPEAARLTDAARAVDPDHVRVKFLSAQIAREQARFEARRRAAVAAAAAATAAAAPATPPPAQSSAPPQRETVVAASAPTLAGAPSSTPPVSEARDPNSVAAVVLQRVYAVDPVFPEAAREHDLTGFVDLEFTVRADGSVTDVTVLKAEPAGVFEKSAVAAVAQWRYRPIARDGVPVSEHARLRLNFAYR